MMSQLSCNSLYLFIQYYSVFVVRLSTCEKVDLPPTYHSFKILTGGSGWESNPPGTLSMPPNGFEVREAHRDPTAPLPTLSLVYNAELTRARWDQIKEQISRVNQRSETAQWLGIVKAETEERVGMQQA